MRKILEKFDPIDVIAFSGMAGCFIGIVVLRKEPQAAATFNEVLKIIVIYYIGKKSGEAKKNGDTKT